MGSVRHQNRHRPKKRSAVLTPETFQHCDSSSMGCEIDAITLGRLTTGAEPTAAGQVSSDNLARPLERLLNPLSWVVVPDRLMQRVLELSPHQNLPARCPANLDRFLLSPQRSASATLRNRSVSLLAE